MFECLNLSERHGPAFGQVDLTPELSLEKLRSVIPVAYTKGQVRLIDERSPSEGYGKEWLSAALGRAVDTLSIPVLDEIFERRLCTLAVQSVDQFDERIAQMAEELRIHTGRRVAVTAFFSPPRSQGTAIHYDRSDVLVLHVDGAKRWSVHEPIEIEPNFRTPYRSPEKAFEQLTKAGDWELRRGNTLFLPSGWVHEVKNDADDMCLHLSFVIFSDSILSVFGNVMTEAYAKLMVQPRWRTRLTVQELNKDALVGEFKEMLAEFSQTFLSTLVEDPGRFCDHVLNSMSGAARRSAARATIANLDSTHEDMQVTWVGGHHRAVRNGSKLEVSTDGSARYGVHPLLYSMCRTQRTLRLSELTTAGQGSADDVVEFVATMVQDLGLLALEPIPKIATSSLSQRV